MHNANQNNHRFSLSIENNVWSNLLDMLWKEEVAGEEGDKKLVQYMNYEHELLPICVRKFIPVNKSQISQRSQY